MISGGSIDFGGLLGIGPGGWLVLRIGVYNGAVQPSAS